MGVDFIEFPKLGIHLNISPIAFTIPIGNGQITVHWYGIIIATAIMIALTLAMRQSKKFGIKEDDLVDMFLVALPVSIVFARLFFVIFTWESYKNNLMGIFKIWEGGLAIYGAVIGALLSVYFYSRRKKINMWELTDFACVYLPLAQAIGRWGNFTNQELYGGNTNLPWGMTGNRIQFSPDPGVNGALPVHPTFLYESLLNLVVFAVLLQIRKKHKVKGTVFASYLMMYSFVRFMMEFMRVDVFGVGAIRYNQVFAALVFIGAFIWFMMLTKRAKHAEEAEEVIGPSAYTDVLHKLEEEEAESRSDEDSDNDSDSTDDKDSDKEEETIEEAVAADIIAEQNTNDES